MMLGGRAAENIIFKSPTSGAQNDLEKVTRSAYDQIKNYGMSTVIGPLSYAPLPNSQEKMIRKPFSKNLGALMDRVRVEFWKCNVFNFWMHVNYNLQEANALVMKAYWATEQLLRDNKDKLDLVKILICWRNFSNFLRNFFF